MIVVVLKKRQITQYQWFYKTLNWILKLNTSFEAKMLFFQS